VVKRANGSGGGSERETFAGGTCIEKKKKKRFSEEVRTGPNGTSGRRFFPKGGRQGISKGRGETRGGEEGQKLKRGLVPLEEKTCWGERPRW